jgi:hypothetical protein
MTSQLHASWETSAEGGVDKSEYAITSSGSKADNDVLKWTATDSFEVTATGITLRHNQEYEFKVRAYSKKMPDQVSDEGKSYVKVDLTPPSQPGQPVPDQALSGKPEPTGRFNVAWTESKDMESGLVVYELQERVDTDPVWRTVSSNIASDSLNYQVSPEVTVYEDGARRQVTGTHFYFYRIRSLNRAGSYSEWSEASKAAPTGLPEEVISQVSNYPNPVDSSKQDTNITYILNQNAEVTITIYDLMGHLVYRFHFDPGEEGGSVGTNVVPWSCINELGDKIATGGYLARIQIKSDKGIITTTRKIGVIRR